MSSWQCGEERVLPRTIPLELISQVGSFNFLYSLPCLSSLGSLGQSVTVTISQSWVYYIQCWAMGHWQGRGWCPCFHACIDKPPISETALPSSPLASGTHKYAPFAPFVVCYYIDGYIRSIRLYACTCVRSAVARACESMVLEHGSLQACLCVCAGQLLMYYSSFEQIELQAKLLNYFLGSNKSNINQ